MKDKKIIILASEGRTTNIVFHGVNNKFPVCKVVIEKKERRNILLKRRIKRLGIIKVIGQIFFQFFLVKFLSAVSAKRVNEIIAENSLDISLIPPDKIFAANSVNHDSVRELLGKINPDLVIVNGTRIISKKILASVSCPVINTHVGITPMYRGVHGGYWALVKRDPAHCGVTVHLVDAGIDTGNILYQDTIAITQSDNFATYPYLQLAKGIPLLQKAAEDALEHKLMPVTSAGNSHLYYHPTAWEYLYHRFFKNVK